MAVRAHVTHRRGGHGPPGGRVLTVSGVIVWVMTACSGGPDADALGVPTDTLAPPVDTVRVALPAGRPVVGEILGVTDAVQGDSGWVVLDARSRRIAFLSPEGDLERVAGREGDGPGEMRRPVALALLGARIAVAERGGRLVFFGADGEPAGGTLIRDADCTFSDVHALLGGGDSLVALSTCAYRSGRTTARVARVGPDGGDRIVAEWTYDDWRSGSMDPMQFPVLAMVGRRLALGVAPDPCLRILGRNGATVRRLCYPDLPRRPLPDSAREALAHLQESLKSRGAGVRIRTSSTYLPAFHALLGGGATWGFLAVPPEGGDAVDRVEGSRLHRIIVPEDGHVFLGRRTLLLAVERVGGTSFGVLPLR